MDNIRTTTLDTPDLRYVEIYKIDCIVTGKSYIGQAVSHILNHGKYRPYGINGRFRCHVSEAFSKKKNECNYLNNAIRKYGKDSFKVELIEKCSCEDADKTESFYISSFNTLFPDGYNLTSGGKSTQLTLESRLKISRSTMIPLDKRLSKFSNLTQEDMNRSVNKIRPLNRCGIQYGWYVYIKGLKTDFGGSLISLDESKKMAEEFIDILFTSAKHLDAGNPL